MRRKRPGWRQVFAAESDGFSLAFALIAMVFAAVFLSELLEVVFPQPVAKWIEACFVLTPTLPVGMLAYYGLVLLGGITSPASRRSEQREKRRNCESSSMEREIPWPALFAAGW